MAYQDLLKDTSVISEDGSYFTLTIEDLEPNTSYPIQLRWKYNDGTFGEWSAVKRLSGKSVAPKPSELPSVPTVKPVVGAIELAWNGKTSTGGDQPYGFNSAKVYIGTTSNFVPTDSGSSKNQVDILNFANGQNTLNIGVGTVVNSSLTLDYGIDYYVKIKTTNGNAAEDSAAVSATGNPVRIGQLSNDGLIEVKADKITTGTLQSSSTITVGSTSGKHVVIRGTGNPLSIYGSGGVAGGTILDFDATGNLSIKGTINATAGAFTGAVSINGDGGSMKIGKQAGQVDGAGDYLDGLYMGSNNYWYNDGIFKVGNGQKNLKFENGNLSLVNTGTVSNSGFGTENVTTTLNSNGLFSIISDEDYYWNWNSSAISVETQVKHTKLYPGSITISLDNDPNGSDFFGSSFTIFHDGMGRTNFLLGDGSSYSPIVWLGYDFSSTYSSSYIYGKALGGDASRSLVVFSDGTQYVGHRNYYGNASSSSMSNATFGVDGDFYYSTNES